MLALGAPNPLQRGITQIARAYALQGHGLPYQSASRNLQSSSTVDPPTKLCAEQVSIVQAVKTSWILCFPHVHKLEDVFDGLPENGQVIPLAPRHVCHIV